MLQCPNCFNDLVKKSQKKYCSNKCQNDYEYTSFVEKWLVGMADGGRGIVAKNISGHVLKYMRSNFGSLCSLCGWDKTHPITGRVPLEIDHIDGDSENNVISNLRMLCPNCHSLTDNFRNLNKGKGREWRRLKYTKN